MKKNNLLLGHLACTFTIFIWATTFVSTKILLRDFTPIEILFIRFAIGLFFLYLIFPKRLSGTTREQEIYMAAAGLCGICLYYLLENIALTYTYASNVGVIICLAPFFTALLSRVFLKEETPSVNFYVGFVIAIAGISLLSLNGSAYELNPFGDLLALAAAFVWACYSVLVKKISRFGINTIQSTRRIFVYGLLFMLPMLYFFDFDPQISLLFKPVNLFNILFLGLGASALCFVSWNYSVRILGAVKTSVYIYAVPVITVCTSIVVLHEKLTALGLLGVLLTIVGLLISENKFSLRSAKRITEN